MDMFHAMHTAAGIDWRAVVMNAGVVFGMVFYAGAIITFVVRGRKI